MKTLALVVLLIAGCSANSYYQRPYMDRACSMSFPSQGIPSCSGGFGR